MPLTSKQSAYSKAIQSTDSAIDVVNIVYRHDGVACNASYVVIGRIGCDGVIDDPSITHGAVFRITNDASRTDTPSRQRD